jgi:hypothetical protein
MSYDSLYMNISVFEVNKHLFQKAQLELNREQESEEKLTAKEIN